ncbi:MAG: cryptochrome/photolyase family protein [Halioglobus sp.]
MPDAQTTLILVLADQLTHNRAALKNATPGTDTILMAEVREEATYTNHNRHKIAFLFSAMRHFRDELIEKGFTVIYYPYEEGVKSLRDAVKRALDESGAQAFCYCLPGEYRLLSQMEGWRLGVPVEAVEDDRFLCSEAVFNAWADGRKQLRMEYFYRDMRRRYDLLLNEDGSPAGGKWNYDSENRKGWRNQVDVPKRLAGEVDDITQDVIDLVNTAFPDNPGDLDQFYLGVTAEQAQTRFDWFVESGLVSFGTYQDALAEESPWVFHSLVSMYLNAGLLDPLAMCQQVEAAYRDGRVELSAAEGFIRQVIGWREYVRGIYWLHMPGYEKENSLDARRPLPEFFWTAETDMRCLHVALKQSLDLGYAHHIQRLMVIGNFALLAGLDVEAVCDWYLGVYVDAYEWVELPNTLGMALHADGGVMASKPYAGSGKYIARQGNHCKQCRYDAKKMTGEGACPYNSLYWHFIDRHLERLEKNPRMNLIVKGWTRRKSAERKAIVEWADAQLDAFAPL